MSGFAAAVKDFCQFLFYVYLVLDLILQKPPFFGSCTSCVCLCVFGGGLLKQQRIAELGHLAVWEAATAGWLHCVALMTPAV